MQHLNGGVLQTSLRSNFTYGSNWCVAKQEVGIGSVFDWAMKWAGFSHDWGNSLIKPN